MDNPTEMKKCPCCGGDLAEFIQEFPHSGRKIPQVTCWNQQCIIYGFTKSPESLVQFIAELKEKES